MYAFEKLQVYWNSLSTLYTLSFSSEVFVCQASLFVLHKDTWRGIICKLGTLVEDSISLLSFLFCLINMHAAFVSEG